MRNEGVAFSLGYLGLPSTLLAVPLLMLLPSSWDPHDFIPPSVGSIFYFVQWQVIAWLLYRWLNRPRKTNQNV